MYRLQKIEYGFTEQSTFFDKLASKKRYVLDGEGLWRDGCLDVHMLTL